MAKDNGNGSVTVVSGDTLSAIAKKYYSSYGYSSWSSYMSFLASRNNIKNVNLIHVGQVIWLSSSGGSTGSTTKPTARKIVTNLTLGQNALSEREVIAEWDYAYESQTDHYVLKWWYSYGTGKYYQVNDQTSKFTYATYSVPTIPGIALEKMKVSVTVTPVAKTKTENNKEVPLWSGEECSRVLYAYKNNSPSDTPSAPDVEIEDYKLTAKVTNVPDTVTEVEFVVNRDNSTYKTNVVRVFSNQATYTITIEAGGNYKVRCRYINDNGIGEWSPWSGESKTKPNAPSGINTCRAESETSVYLSWDTVENATSYDLEYAEKREYLEGSNQTSTETGIKSTSYIMSGLESGKEYFFRLRAVNSQGESAWTDIVSVIVGTEPAAPTTWSSTTTVITGETLTLYWVHNSEDGSAQTKANVELTIDGVTSYYEIDTSSEDENEKTMHYAVGTSGFVEGATILWRVQTAGATKTYGDWSVQRTVKVYAPPTVSMNLLDHNGAEITTLMTFPLIVSISSGPKTQTPVGYHISIVANSQYETRDNIGLLKIVNEGEEVYSKYIDSSLYDKALEISAGDVYFANNITYTVRCVLSMDSGLTGEDSRNFTVGWDEIEYAPNAMVFIDNNDLTADVMPYCEDSDGVLMEDVALSIYRREFDGSFTEIITNLVNSRSQYITDPHPALDYARYRIVARSNTTGSVGYYDLPGVLVGEKAVVIQWNETWKPYESTENPNYQKPWFGSMLKLPYNIDVSESNTIDTSLVEYIGRKHPVSYYGTQVGQTQSWSVEIPKTDIETIYALRRLSVWMGDVYIREPSGSGYWANISVSFSQRHLDTTIPVKFSITRVAGGM